MSDVVFILGAGASRQCGAPLMADFLDTASDLLLSNRAEEKAPQFQRVFSAIGALQSVHSKAQLDLNNIESIFTALELGKIIKRVPGVEHQEIAEVIAALKDLIVKTLEATISFPVSRNYIHAPEPYGKFAKLVKYLCSDAQPTKSTSVITFNYDIAADIALYREGLGPDYVLGGNFNSHSPVDLLKLHGSLNWAEVRDNRKILPLHPHEYFQKYSVYGFEDHSKTHLPFGRHLREFYTRHADPAQDVLTEPVIVPPSWNKADYHQALSDIWAKAADHLSEAEYIFIAGYSLPETDSFFKHLFALGSVGKSPLRKIQIFNPDKSGETDGRFRRLLGPGALARYEYLPMTFEDSISHVKALFPGRK